MTNTLIIFAIAGELRIVLYTVVTYVYRLNCFSHGCQNVLNVHEQLFEETQSGQNHSKVNFVFASWYAMQSQNAVSAYFTCKQMLPFGFAELITAPCIPEPNKPSISSICRKRLLCNIYL